MASAVRRGGGAAAAAAARRLLDHHQRLLPSAWLISTAVSQEVKRPDRHVDPGQGFARGCRASGLGLAGSDGDGVERWLSCTFVGRVGSQKHGLGEKSGGSWGIRRLSGASNKRETDVDAIASQMIGYAATNRNRVESHMEVSRVLEQGYNFLLSQGPSTENPAAKDATEVLQRAVDLEGASLEVHVSACEALVAVFLRVHKVIDAILSSGEILREWRDDFHPFRQFYRRTMLDADALSVALRTLELVKQEEGLPVEQAEELKFRAGATVQFVEHASSAKISGAILDVSGHPSWFDQKDVSKDGLAAALMGIAECAHVRGHFARAKDYYGKALELAEKCCEREPLGSRAGATTPEEVRMQAKAGLGQVAAHLGHFDDAEKEITAALVHAEQINGKEHTRVGAILACLADVYAQRGVAKGGGDLILAEGLYRKALDLLRAVPVEENPGPDQDMDMADVIAVTRARYAALLARFRNRESEANKLQASAMSSWKGPRSLTDVLDQESSTQPSPSPMKSQDAIEDTYSGRYVVIDTRLGRVLYSPSNL